ncbi:hypothetical protein Pmani_033580 [Petrolisthes manimaculis]|uniref:TOG domain-containing protein n=1 Tax=Petrolisthes manimaculis TaxID=1843537 RepID=A0AAE1NP82_9EUCA|nr:hypothetical protein Pmani_033580 [Petrolisthes manimaculis]
MYMSLIPIRDVLERVEAEEAGAGRRQVNLSEQDKKDAALPLDVFGRELVEKIYSKNYSEKEAGLRQLQEQLTNYTSEAGVRPDRYVRAAVVLVRRALRDKVYSVGLLASHTLTHILSHFVSKHKIAKKEVGATVDKVLPELLAKTADNATRTQQLAVQAILTLLDFSLDRGVGSVGGEVTRPLTSGVHPRAALCRATIVQNHLAARGFHSLPRDKESGFTPKHLVEFAHSAFRHQNSDVRKVGEQLLLSLYTHFPGPVRKTLPTPDDPARKTVLYRNFFEQLEMVDKKRESAPTPRGQQQQQQPRTSPPLATTTTTTTTTVPSQSTSTTPPHYHTSRASSSSSSDREEPGGRIGEERGRAGGRDEEDSRVGGRRREREDLRERREGSEVARIKREEGRRGSREDSRESVREWRGSDDRGGVGGGGTSERETINERRKGGHSRGDNETTERVSTIPREVNGTREGRDTRRDTREEAWQDVGGGEVWGGRGEADMGGCGAVPQISITPDESEVRGRALSRLNGALPSAPPSPGDPEDKTCIFCGEYDPGFSEAGLDVHYWRSCPLLTRCHHCRQVVEVASLTNHLLGKSLTPLPECTSSNEFRRCDRCSEAIPKNAYSTHALAKTCTPCQPEPLANHCPLCHDNIPPWDQGWRTHLLPGPHACPANPRARSQGSKGVAAREKSPERKGSGGSGGGGGGGVREGGKPRLSSSSGTPGTPRRNVSRRR